MPDEEQLAAHAMSNILTSAMFRAHDVDKRAWLYSWELDGFRWLIRFHDRRPDGLMCAWAHSFMTLNREALLGGTTNVMDWNLRAARLARDEAIT